MGMSTQTNPAPHSGPGGSHEYQLDTNVHVQHQACFDLAHDTSQDPRPSWLEVATDLTHRRRALRFDAVDNADFSRFSIGVLIHPQILFGQAIDVCISVLLSNLNHLSTNL